MLTGATAARIDALTGLRIVAAALVFLSHFAGPQGIGGPAGTFLAAGYNGVTLFFVLSGFVIAWNYADRLARPSGRALWSYAVARVARIYPLYLFALLWAAAPAIVVGTLPESAWQHVLAVQTWSPDVFVAYALNGPGWSIGVEFFLYACFPLLILAVAPLRRRPGLLLAVAVAAVLVVGALAWWFTATGRGVLGIDDPGSAHRWLYRTPLSRLGDFLVGVCAALLARQVRVRPGVGTAVQVASVATIAAFMAWPTMLNSAWSWDVAYMVPGALLIWSLAVAPRSPLGRLLSTRPMVVAGEASFAFYLLHAPLLARLSIGPVDRWYALAFTAALEFAIILMVAIGAHLVIELPAQRGLRGLLDRPRRPEPVADPVPPVPIRQEPVPEPAAAAS